MHLIHFSSFPLKLLTHLLPLVTKVNSARDPSGFSLITTLRSHLFHFPLPHQGPRSLHSLLSPGRAPNSRHITPTWTRPPAPWPKAVAPPHWPRASRPHRAPLASTKAEGPVGSWRLSPLCWPCLPPHQHRLCHPALSQTLSPRLLPSLRLRCLPVGPLRTSCPLASPSPNSLWALAAASAWRWRPARGFLLPPQGLDVMWRQLQESKVGGRTVQGQELRVKTFASVIFN